uniref:Alpha-1,6-mannosyl-glycoprotein 2-beta-N-acetylglucosaminyltransferase n=1 Tax=Caenorhabditis japonica TaxID=281687 RepID=A0A8R1DUJ0_CAEJA
MMVYRRMHRIANVVIACCLFGFIVIFLKTPVDDPRIRDGVPLVANNPGWSSSDWKGLNKDVSDLLKNDSMRLANVEKPDWSGWDFKPADGQSLSGAEIVESVSFLNENFDILNSAKFGDLSDVQTVLVIQVHNRPVYLQYLIESMRNTKGIEKTLLVFSHDINVAVINEMIRNITFARVYQIFYPYNMQLFPSVFPGQSTSDCPEKMAKDRAQEVNCSNWSSPDKYGNYRVAQLTQIKHHWWWKMNFVFDGIVEKFSMNNPWVLLLEEDHMLAPDALHVLDIIVSNRRTFCENCEIISLGFYLKSTKKYGLDIAHLGVHPWYSSKHNMGMALQKSTWAKIKSCSEMFCKWDDYNWDWSLMQISAKCLPQRFRVIFAKSPRVIHIGDCGVHTHRCEAHKALQSTKELFEAHKKLLFPSILSVTDTSRRSLKPSKENGGWGDVRDRQLCEINKTPLLRVSPRSPSVLSEMLNSKVPFNTNKTSSTSPNTSISHNNL